MLAADGRGQAHAWGRQNGRHACSKWNRAEACMGQIEKGRHACSRGMHGANGGRRVINEIQRNNPHCNNKGPQSLYLLFPRCAACQLSWFP